MSRASRERSRIWYQKMKQDIASRTSTMFARSEGGNRYQYDIRIASLFDKWSREQRDKGITPMFGHFYNKLQPVDQEQITVTQIFKDNETEKTNEPNCR